MSDEKYTPDFATLIKNRARDTGECPIFDFCERKECRGCVVSKWLNGKDEIPAADVEPETPDTDPPKWISVKERLPAEAGTYLVAVYIDDVKSNDCYQLVLMAWYNPKTDPYPLMGWTLLNEWYDMTNDLRDYITHWQPWPEPPEI